MQFMIALSEDRILSIDHGVESATKLTEQLEFAYRWVPLQFPYGNSKRSPKAQT